MAVPGATHERRTLRLLLMIAIAAAVLDDAGYLVLITSQGSYPPEAFVVPFVAAFIALTAVMLAISLLNRPLVSRLRPPLRGGAAAGLLVLGVLGAFSIGLPLFIAGVLAAIAAVWTLADRRPPAVFSQIGAAALDIAVHLAGFEVTGRLIVCPAKGYMSGSGYALVTGGYHWTCVDGHLDYRPGFCSSGGGGVDANGHAFATSSC
jgi:hypothetical protein